MTTNTVEEPAASICLHIHINPEDGSAMFLRISTHTGPAVSPLPCFRNLLHVFIGRA